VQEPRSYARDGLIQAPAAQIDRTAQASNSAPVRLEDGPGVARAAKRRDLRLQVANRGFTVAVRPPRGAYRVEQTLKGWVPVSFQGAANFRSLECQSLECQSLECQSLIVLAEDGDRSAQSSNGVD